MSGLSSVLLGSAIAFTMSIAAYVVYLGFDGQVGRAYVKAQRAAYAHRGYRYELTATGGDCDSFGVWNEGERTCSLTGDIPLDSPILISAKNITLEGNQHKMVGRESSLPAISLILASGVTVRNLAISGYRDGVYVNYSTENTLSGLVIRNTERHGIAVENDSNFNTISHNEILDTGMHGIAITSSHGNFVWANELRNTRDAIRLQAAHHNYIVENLMEHNRIEGLDFHSSNSNVVHGNTVLDLEAIPIISQPPHLWSNFLDILGRGNRYAAYDEPAEGCDDVDDDGICDEPYEFPGGVDPKPISAAGRVTSSPGRTGGIQVTRSKRD